MIKLLMEQNSPEWVTEKLGKPSASRCSEIISPKGKPSASAKPYMYELASERITGAKNPDKYTNNFIQEGHDREQEARDLYCLVNEVELESVGVVYRDEKKQYLCSPDALVLNPIFSGDEGLECKNVMPKTQVKRLIDNVLPSEYFGQIQFSLLVTGFKIWNFFSYAPCMRPLHIRVQRDEKFIALLEIELNLFCKRLDEITGAIR